VPLLACPAVFSALLDKPAVAHPGGKYEASPALRIAFGGADYCQE